MTTFINCTPHALTVHGLGTIQPSGIVSRVATTRTETSSPDLRVRIIRQSLGEVTGLPDPAPDTYYIVSGMVLQASERTDLVAPDTGPDAIRQNGLVVAVRGFVVGGV